MCRRWKKILPLSIIILLFPCLLILAQDQGPCSVKHKGALVQVKGTLRDIEGVPVLTVWGTPWEQGFAHGYLLQDAIIHFFDRFLSSGKIMDIKRYESSWLKTRVFHFAPRFEAELRGMLEGIEARAGGPVEAPVMGRELRYGDLVMANCMGELGRFRMSCSSFAAWGPMTKDGHTLAGRNYEWPLCPSLLGVQVVVVRLPSPGSESSGTVSVFFPGLLGCITAMNGEGVTVSTHDSTGNPSTVQWGYTPHTLLYREALEAARSDSAVEDIGGVLRKHFSITGNNMMVTRPYEGRGPGGFVYEHDPNLLDEGGATLRAPYEEENFLICTNRYYERKTVPENKLRLCGRFKSLTRQLAKIEVDCQRKPMSLYTAWKVTESVPLAGIVTYHRAIFEPNKRLMHVAFPADGEPVKKITLDVAKLLKQGEEDARK